jgi:hypothetical protein
MVFDNIRPWKKNNFNLIFYTKVWLGDIGRQCQSWRAKRILCVCHRPSSYTFGFNRHLRQSQVSEMKLLIFHTIYNWSEVDYWIFLLSHWHWMTLDIGQLDAELIAAIWHTSPGRFANGIGPSVKS